MSVEQVLWPDDVPFNNIPIVNFQGGVTTDVIQVRIFNDRSNPATGSVLRNNFISLSAQNPAIPTDKITSGIAPLDELWAELRFVDSSSNVDPYITGWLRIGSGNIIPFPQMIADSYRTFEIRFSPPSYVNTNPYLFFTNVHVNERVYGLTGQPGVDIHRGVLTGYGDARQTTLLSGSHVTASAIPDDKVDVNAGHMMFQGVREDFDAVQLTVDQFDGAVIPEELAIGESYILMVTRDSASSIIQVKSLRDVSPILPPKPLDEVFVCYIKVDFVGVATAPIIGDEDITMTTFWGHHYAQLLDGLDVRIHGGNILSSGTWRTTFEFEDFTMTADEDNYFWSRADGTYSVTLDDILPDTSSDLLYVFTADATDIILIGDERKFIDVVDTGIKMVDTINPLPFAANFNTTGNFGVANGIADDGDSISAPKTRTAVFAVGAVRFLTYFCDAADATTEMRIFINGVDSGTSIFLSSILPSGSGFEQFTDIAAGPGDYLELQFFGGTDPGESSFQMIYIVAVSPI